jgi:hydrogenase/urease accessory protein HupE
MIRYLTLLLATLLLPLGHAWGHDARPVYVEIHEWQPGTFAAHWKVPVSVPAFALPALAMPGNCRPQGETLSGQAGDAWTAHQVYLCPKGLAGRELVLHYPNNNPSLSALFRVSLADGAVHTRVLNPGQDSWRVPETETLWRVAVDYGRLGVEHIFAGLDHLLFVACLVFIARTPRRILITITGFTLAHSLTLALSTLGLVRLPIPPVEAVIALSIVFLAHEIAVANHHSWTWRYPVAVSSSFGLLHGFGFAAVLGDIGLPQSAVPAALLIFNLGVELGQLLFIAALALVAISAGRLVGGGHRRLLDHRRTAQAGGYVIGTLASYWLIARIVAF